MRFPAPSTAAKDLRPELRDRWAQTVFDVAAAIRTEEMFAAFKGERPVYLPEAEDARLQGAVDAAILAADTTAATRAFSAWKGAWLFSVRQREKDPNVHGEGDPSLAWASRKQTGHKLADRVPGPATANPPPRTAPVRQGAKQRAHGDGKMKFSDYSGGAFFKAADVEQHPIRAVIASVRREKIGSPPDQQEKFIVAFEGSDRRLVLNQTNGQVLATSFGDEIEEGWIGRKIELFFDSSVVYQGHVGAIRVRAIDAPARAQAAPVDLATQGAEVF